MPRNEVLLGVDTGGTFIDIVLAHADGDVIAAFKESGSDDPVASVARGVERALAASGVAAGDVTRVVYGTTMATNLVLERRGARVACVLTQGFQDMPFIGRETRGGRSIYDLRYTKADPLVDVDACFGVPGRVDAGGAEVLPFDGEAAEAVVGRIAAGGFDAVAVCFVNSYANAAHELRFVELLRRDRPDLYVARSSSIWPEFREYERMTTTIVSAYVGPRVSAHLLALQERFRQLGIGAWVEVMQSHGGTGSLESVRERPVSILESGPAAGLLGASRIAAQVEADGAIAFDMGGTTAKAGITLGGRPVVTSEFHVGGEASSASRHDGRGLPVRVPVVDLAEVGAGGGSLARVDDWGAVKVGPESAGARPGPASYGRGGQRPTITDGDLVLGYLGSSSLTRSEVTLSVDAAHRAIEDHVAGPLGIAVVDAARAMGDIANAKMAEAIHLVSVARGVDARRMTLIGFGGAGPSHVVALAEHFGIDAVVVPRFAGVMSALGMLTADLVDESVATVLTPLDEMDGAAILAVATELREAAVAKLAHQGVDTGGARAISSLDMRYRHQSHELTLELAATEDGLDVGELTRSFHKRSAERYGVVTDDAVELVNIRVRLVVPRAKFALPPLGDRPPARPVGERMVHFWGAHGSCTASVYAAEDLAPSVDIAGPAIVEDRFASLVVPPTWSVATDRSGHLRLSPTTSGGRSGRS